MNRLIMLAALMLSLVGGLWVMSGSAPLAAQTTPSASRSFSSDTVMPGGELTVTITAANYGSVGGVIETLPDGFTYVSQDGADRAVELDNGDIRFTLQGADKSFSYVVTASDTEATYSFSGNLIDDDTDSHVIGGDTDVTVAADAPPPAPGPLVLPNLDSGASSLFTAPEGSGNSVDYTARVDDDTDAKVSVRVSPGSTAILDIDLDIDVPSDKKVSFSLTDGANLDFQVKNNGDGTAQIRVKSDVSLSSGTHNFQLVVNEQGNAPANTQDIDIEVTVVIDNEAPEWTNAPSSGMVAERAQGATIETFSATDVNNQVLEYSLSDDAPSWVEIGPYNGVLSTKSDDAMQPDYNEDSPEMNTHTFTVTVSDGTLTKDASFALTVTDVPDPEPGSNQKKAIDEGMGKADFGTPLVLEGTGDYSVDQQIDNRGNITIDSDDILFGVDASSGQLYLKQGKAVDFESGLITYTLSVSRGGGPSAIVVVSVNDVNEAPTFSASDKARTMPIELFVLESAAVGTILSIGQDAGGNPTTISATFTASDQDSADTGNAIAYDLWKGSDEYAGKNAMFAVSSNGTIWVNTLLDTDADDSVSTIDLTLRAVDAGEQSDTDPMSSLADTLMLRISVIDTNVAPEFDVPSRALTHAIVSEGAAVGTMVHTYRATDEDGDPVRYRLRDADDAPFFSVEETTNSDGEPIGILRTAAGLDYEMNTSHTVEIQAYDTDGDTDEIAIEIQITNENDETPYFTGNPLSAIPVQENTPRGTQLGNSYAASDPDGFDISYSLSGDDADSFMISDSGVLMTLESLDYDRPVPCGGNICNITVNANDGAETLSMAVAITVTGAEDSVSTVDISKANPVPGTAMGDPMSALAGTKTTYSAAVPERPADLPATKGDAPMNFVETEWGSWGTVLRIEVTAQSPDATCGNGNQCVVVNVNSDSADDSLKVQAYRSNSQENKFVAAVELVELEADATNVKDSGGNDVPVYKHTDGGVPALQVDEEDEVEIEFGNLRSSVDVENEAPEIDNFSPAHELAFDDADVDYAFSISDAHSGLPEPEDLPDNDGDADYTPVVALISRAQCETHSGSSDTLMVDGVRLSKAAQVNDEETLYCPGTPQNGEYEAHRGGFGFAPIRDDKDFDDVDDGYDVETTIVLTENRTYYVTFVVCDNAGNCAFYDPDGNDDNEELAQITVDTEDPVFVEARTGLTWDSTDNEYDDNRSFIQVIFNELTALNPETVETDDFVVEGHTIKDVHVFENPDDDDVNWADSGRYAKEGNVNKRGEDRYRDIENTVFIELEDELLADETPDVTLVPNGVEDGAGNEQDDGEQEANDWISPKFTIVSITSTLETAQSEVLAGDGDEVTLVVTADERLDATRPTVSVTYVNANRVDTKGTASCDIKGSDDKKGTRDRGEIVNNDYCQDSSAAKGGTLNNSVEKVSNTEWIVTVTEPKDTGYYSFRISGIDRSPQENPGSEGVAPDDIVTDFFDSDGDVNVDDAVFWEGDINLANPNVRVSGEVVTDNEPDVEFRSPLFVEIDFTTNHWSSVDCRGADNDEEMANCTNENSEYAEDNFDDVVITMFELNGVDMTDSVRTTDDQTFLVTLDNVALGDHTAKIQAMDVAGNTLEDVLEIDFEVSDRDPFERRLNPGWNLVSLPGEPADSSIASVFGSGVEVRTVYTYDPVIPGGWMVAVRETLDSDWQGDLTEISGSRGYWVHSDAIQDWEVSIPRLAGGADGTGTPIQPPVIPLYAGWNLIPVTDVKGNALDGGTPVNAMTYLQSLGDGVEPARVLGFDTIRNEWYTVLDGDMSGPGMGMNLQIGSAYWVFVREAVSLVPGGVAGGGSGD